MTYKPKNNRPGLTPAIVEEELRKGKTFAQIGRDFGVSRQAPRDTLKRAGIPIPTNETTQTTQDNMPWKGSLDKFRHSKQHQYLFAYAEFMLEGAESLSAARKEDLRAFTNKLKKGMVLALDQTVGFYWVPRTPEDNNLVVRVDEYTNLTNDGETILWVLPNSEQWEEISRAIT